MLTTPHLLVGAAIGAQFNNPMLVVPAAAGSHFVFDSIPHLMGFIEVEDLDKKDLAFVVGDVVLGVALVAALSINNPHAEMLWLGAFASVLPDFHHTFQVLFGPEKLERYTKIHLRFHYKKPMKVLPGMVTQIVTSLVAIALVLRPIF